MGRRASLPVLRTRDAAARRATSIRSYAASTTFEPHPAFACGYEVREVSGPAAQPAAATEGRTRAAEITRPCFFAKEYLWSVRVVMAIHLHPAPGGSERAPSRKRGALFHSGDGPIGFGRPPQRRQHAPVVARVRTAKWKLS